MSRAIVARACADALWRRNMPTGTVKWFNPQKGFGFIQPDDGGNDVFVHISEVERAGLVTLNDGQRVSFDVETGRRRWRDRRRPASQPQPWRSGRYPAAGCRPLRKTIAA